MSAMWSLSGAFVDVRAARMNCPQRRRVRRKTTISICMVTPFGRSMLNEARQGSLLAILFHLAFWHMDLSYFGRGLLGSWPQPDAGVVLWSLSAYANDWQSADKLTRLCTIPQAGLLAGTKTRYAMEARILRPLLWFELLEQRSEKVQTVHPLNIGFIERRSCSIIARLRSPSRTARRRSTLKAGCPTLKGRQAC